MKKNFVRKKSAIMMKIELVTTVHVVLFPTPSVPPSVFSPFQQAEIAIKKANTTVFAIPVSRSAMVKVSSALAMKKLKLMLSSNFAISMAPTSPT